MDLRTLQCPSCMAPVEIPLGATRIRCSYCGKEVVVSQPKPPAPVAPPAPIAPSSPQARPSSRGKGAASLVVVLAAVGTLAVVRAALKPASSHATTAVIAGPTTPPTPVWADTKLSFRGIPSTGSLLLSDLDCTLTFEKLPAGTQVSVGDVRGSANDSGYLSLKVPFAERLGAISPLEAIDFRSKIDPKLTASMEFPTGVKLSLPLPSLGVSFGVKSALAKAPNRPVLFGSSDTKNGPSEHSVLWLGASEEVLGPAKTLSEVDLIAVKDNLPVRKGKQCPGYKISGKDEKQTLEQELQDFEVSVVERRTSKLVAKKRFPASPDCPMLAFQGRAQSYPDTNEIKAWLRELRTSKSDAPSGGKPSKR